MHFSLNIWPIRDPALRSSFISLLKLKPPSDGGARRSTGTLLVRIPVTTICCSVIFPLPVLHQAEDKGANQTLYVPDLSVLLLSFHHKPALQAFPRHKLDQIELLCWGTPVSTENNLSCQRSTLLKLHTVQLSRMPSGICKPIVLRFLLFTSSIKNADKTLPSPVAIVINKVNITP